MKKIVFFFTTELLYIALIVLAVAYLLAAIVVGIFVDITVGATMILAPLMFGLIAVIALFVIAMVVIGIAERVDDIVAYFKK